MSNITLVAERLQFVSLGTKSIHALDLHHTRWKTTLCGRDIPEDWTPMPVREASSDRLCKRCLASLQTYTRTLSSSGGGIRLERIETFVKIEQEGNKG